MARLESGAVGRATFDTKHHTGRADSEEVRALIDAAEQSRRARICAGDLRGRDDWIAAGELCGLRRWRDLDLARGLMRVSTSVLLLPERPLGEIPTKNRRVRMLAVDDLTADPYVFTDAADGSEPWKPATPHHAAR